MTFRIWGAVRSVVVRRLHDCRTREFTETLPAQGGSGAGATTHPLQARDNRPIDKAYLWTDRDNGRSSPSLPRPGDSP